MIRSSEMAGRLQRGALLAGVLAAAVGFAMIAGMGGTALSQDQSTATSKDVIFARKILMDAIGHNMDELEGIVASSKVDLNEGHEHADMISVMLMSFPHLFPPASNQWKPNVERDPGTDTSAAPEVWSNYADFYERAAAASKAAFNASRADKEADFKGFVGELRTACDSCHALYYKQ
jgi:cytochrome c556